MDMIRFLSLNLYWKKAVSYTHLEGAIVFIPPFKTSDEELNALLKDFCVQNVRQSKWWHGVPVSYTQLDVYKRQG